MTEKMHKYKLPDSFVERCVNALSFYEVIDEISVKEGETGEDAVKRLAEIMEAKKTEYRLMFIQYQ